jgi:hypothetical protein
MLLRALGRFLGELVTEKGDFLGLMLFGALSGEMFIVSSRLVCFGSISSENLRSRLDRLNGSDSESHIKSTIWHNITFNGSFMFITSDIGFVP